VFLEICAVTSPSASAFDIRYLDIISSRDTSIHRLDPRAKLLTTLAYIVVVASFDKYTVTGLVPFVIYPVVLVALGDLPVAYLLRKVMLAAPFAVFVGMFNPVFDREVLLHWGPVPISGGWVSFLSIMLRFTLTVASALLLVATTGFHGVCLALDKLGAPRAFVVQLLFLYRYLFLLGDEATRLTRARALRSFEGRGLGMRVFSSLAGQLLLRTLDRARRIHLAMLCRGFDGEIRHGGSLRFSRWDLAYTVGWSGLFALLRVYDVPQLAGRLVMGLAR
jgi:cobalt/nickel transport system permease protein